MLLKLPAVIEMTQRRKSSIYADIAAGTFPPPVKIGPRAVAWSRTDIEQWMDARPRSVCPSGTEAAAQNDLVG